MVYNIILSMISIFLALSQTLLEEEILAAVEKVLDQHYG